jgi:hypothetical protein
MQQVLRLSSTARMHTPRGDTNSHTVDVHFRASTETLHRGGVACSMQVVRLSSTACTAALLVTTECTPVKLAWEQSSLQLAIISVSLSVARLPSKVALNHRLRSQCALNVVAYGLRTSRLKSPCSHRRSHVGLHGMVVDITACDHSHMWSVECTLTQASKTIGHILFGQTG